MIPRPGDWKIRTGEEMPHAPILLSDDLVGKDTMTAMNRLCTIASMLLANWMQPTPTDYQTRVV